MKKKTHKKHKILKNYLIIIPLILFLITLLFALFAYLFSLKNPSNSGKELVNLPPFNCDEISASDFKTNPAQYRAKLLCYIEYYSSLTSVAGTKYAIQDEKYRATHDEFSLKECHQIMHSIGRATGKNSKSVDQAFNLGDSYCHYGFYHGSVEGYIVENYKSENIKNNINDICAPFRKSGQIISEDDYNCAHGIGHGLMRLNKDELITSLDECDMLSDESEQQSCWNGAFMENTVAYMLGDTTKYIDQKNFMYPCNIVDPKYQDTCYSFQISFYLKMNKDFKNSFSVCENIPSEYKKSCFQGLGRDLVTSAGNDVSKIDKTGCLYANNQENQESCVMGVVSTLVHYQNTASDSRIYCDSLPSALQEKCINYIKNAIIVKDLMSM